MRKKNIKERIISIVLTLTMVVSLFAGMAPVEAQAQEVTDTIENTEVQLTKTGEGTFKIEGIEEEDGKWIYTELYEGQFDSESMSLNDLKVSFKELVSMDNESIGFNGRFFEIKELNSSSIISGVGSNISVIILGKYSHEEHNDYGDHFICFEMAWFDLPTEVGKSVKSSLGENNGEGGSNEENPTPNPENPEPPDKKTIDLSTLKVGDLVEVGTTLIADKDGAFIYVHDYKEYLRWMFIMNYQYEIICEKLGITWEGDYPYFRSCLEKDGEYKLNDCISANFDEGNITTASLWLCYDVKSEGDDESYYFVSPDNLGGSSSALQFEKESYKVAVDGTVILQADFIAEAKPEYDYEVEYSLGGSYVSGTTINSATGMLTVAEDEEADSIMVLAMVQATEYSYDVVYVTNTNVSVTKGSENPGETVTAPVITTQPQDVNVTEGDSATFTVVATGDDLKYQWKLNGVDIEGATNATYTIAATTTANSGKYQCVVTNAGGEVTSDLATLIVADHSWSEWTPDAQNADNHSRKCNNTNCTATESVAHNYTDNVCDTCGHTMQSTPSEHEHKPTAVPETKATCTTAGIKGHYKCDCGTLFEDEAGTKPITDVVIPVTDHSWSEWTPDAQNADNHSRKCNNTNCTATESVAHADTNKDNKCDVCEYTMQTSTPGTGSGSDSGSGGSYYPSYPSTGGSTGGSSSSGTTGGTQITVPVKNPETAVHVTAKVEGNKATVDAIKDEEIAKVIDSKDETAIEIDFTGLDKPIDTAVIPTESMEKILKAVFDTTNKIEGLNIRLSTAIVTLDAVALKAVVGQADGDKIQLNVDDVHTGRLNDVQMKAVEKLDVHKGIEAYFTCNGKRIGDFKGGAVTLELPFEIPTGYKPAGFSVWYVDDNGNSTKYKSSYANGMLSFIVDHFSDFIVVYDEADAEQKETETKPETEQPVVKENNSFRYLRLKGKETTEDTIKLVWNKVADADGYVLYGNKCNANGKKYTIKKVMVIKDGTVSKEIMKDLEKGTYYKYYIKAYKLVNGKKVFLGKSNVVHVTTAGGKYGNAKAVSVNATEVTLNVGETFDIQAKQVKENKKIAKHTNIKFESSKSSVAKVNKNGTITAKKKGTATIYVYAQNGVYKKVKVTVK